MNLVNCKLLAGVASIVAFLSACNGPTQASSSSFVQSASIISKAAPKSWIQGGVGQRDLLYVMSPWNESVYILTYPQMKLVGVIGQAGMQINTQGLCSDVKGNVFLTLAEPVEIVEYSHGGTKSIATLTLPNPNAYPENCSYDPTTGDLAITYSGVGSGNSGVAIYANETGTPQMYADKYATSLLFCGYDDKGNLFIDGQGSEGATLSELPKGAKDISLLTINERIQDVGSVQWDGKHMTLFLIGPTDESDIFRLGISGSEATVVGTTRLGLIGGSWSYIAGHRVTVGNQAKNAVQMFKYPGGDPMKSLPVYQASDVVVSLAPRNGR